MNVDSSGIAGGSMRGEGGLRRCFCHFLRENNGTGCYNAGGDSVVSGGGGGRDTTAHCTVCVRNLLRSSLQRHGRALRAHAAAREECARKLGNSERSHLPELQAESQRLRDKKASLRVECGEMAVKITKVAVENDTIRERISADDEYGSSSPLERQRLDLQRIERGLLEGSLAQAIETSTSRVRFLRFQWARKVFAMYRLQIDPEDIKLTPVQKRRQESQPGQQLQRRARGIAKISGLPLPNAGPELYGVLPPRELQSALRIVATVTSTVARCLGIVVPHRILLNLHNSTFSTGDITDVVSEDDLRQRHSGSDRNTRSSHSNAHRHNNHDPSFSNRFNRPIGSNNGGSNTNTGGGGYGATSSSSTSSLYSVMDTSYFYKKAKSALAMATGQYPAAKKSGGNNASVRSGMVSSSRSSSNSSHTNNSNSNSNSNSTIDGSYDASIVAQRLNHATAAILTDIDSTSNNNSSSSRFALSCKAMHQGDDFAIALQLLQNDIITLCIRAGVPISKLWPAEALLLNLHELDKFCQKQTSVDY